MGEAVAGRALAGRGPLTRFDRDAAGLPALARSLAKQIAPVPRSIAPALSRTL